MQEKRSSSVGFAVLSVVAIGALLAENLLMFPMSVPYLEQFSHGAPILDMRHGYTPAEAYQLFDSLGEAGRSANLTLYWTVDLILPLLFGSFLAGAIARGAFFRWRSVPVLAALFDYAENVAIASLLLRYPEHHPVVAYLASVLTICKQGLYFASALLALSGALLKLHRRR